VPLSGHGSLRQNKDSKRDSGFPSSSGAKNARCGLPTRLARKEIVYLDRNGNTLYVTRAAIVSLENKGGSVRTDGFGSRTRIFYRKHNKLVNSVIILLGVYAILAGIGVFYKPLSPELLLRKENTDAVARYVLSYGWAAPIFFIALQVCQVVILPLPGQVIGIVAGYIFGWKLGVTYTMVGLALGMVIVFTLSRKLGRSFVEKLNGPEAMRDLEGLFSSRNNNVSGFYQKSAQTLRSNALLTFFLFMLLPGLPDNLACFVSGLTRIPVRYLLMAALVGRFPAALALSLFGDGWSKAESSTTLLVLAGLALLSTVVFLWKKQKVVEIVRKVAGWSDT
jgi:uncharacterized membrane protein YdjX (TVP38/TMEM64 family)